MRIERLRPQFVKIPEVDSLAELVVEESKDWDDIQNKFELLTQAWNSVSQNNQWLLTTHPSLKRIWPNLEVQDVNDENI